MTDREELHRRAARAIEVSAWGRDVPIDATVLGYTTIQEARKVYDAELDRLEAGRFRDCPQHRGILAILAVIGLLLCVGVLELTTIAEAVSK